MQGADQLANGLHVAERRDASRPSSQQTPSRKVLHAAKVLHSPHRIYGKALERVQAYAAAHDLSMDAAVNQIILAAATQDPITEKILEAQDVATRIKDNVMGDLIAAFLSALAKAKREGKLDLFRIYQVEFITGRLKP